MKNLFILSVFVVFSGTSAFAQQDCGYIRAMLMRSYNQSLGALDALNGKYWPLMTQDAQALEASFEAVKGEIQPTQEFFMEWASSEHLSEDLKSSLLNGIFTGLFTPSGAIIPEQAAAFFTGKKRIQIQNRSAVIGTDHSGRELIALWELTIWISSNHLKVDIQSLDTKKTAGTVSQLQFVENVMKSNYPSCR